MKKVRWYQCKSYQNTTQNHMSAMADSEMFHRGRGKIVFILTTKYSIVYYIILCKLLL